MANPNLPTDVSFPSEEELVVALQSGALVVDVRRPVSEEAINGVFRTISGAISSPFDKASGTMSVGALPEQKDKTIIVTCRSGSRASKAQTFLQDAGYISVLNGGGPLGPEKLWQVLVNTRGESALKASNVSSS